MTKRTKTLLLNEKNLFFMMSTLFVCLLGAYMYLVSATVMHVVLQTEINQEVNRINSDISELENRLILAQHKVSSSIASLDGFTTINDKVFIDRTPDSLVLGQQNRPQ